LARFSDRGRWKHFRDPHPGLGYGMGRWYRGMLLLPLRQERFFLIAHEHAAHLRCREEILLQLIVPHLFREPSQGLHRSGEHRARLADLPKPLMEPADPALDLPQFPRQSNLLR
jgi:hypothetical protein